MPRLADRFFSEQEGQGMAEYALILAFIAMAALGAVSSLGRILLQRFDQMTIDFGF